MIKYIKSDLYRYYGKHNLKTFLYGIIFNKCFRFTFYLRLCQSKGIFKIIGLMLWTLSKNGPIQIHYKTKIGYGLYLGHPCAIVVNPTAVIGNNCNIGHCVTIGSNNNHAAIIGDNVYIGPNTVLIEDVNIGDNVTIGAGSVVTKNIPKNATACGNYAKIINYSNPGKYVKNRWRN